MKFLIIFIYVIGFLGNELYSQEEIKPFSVPMYITPDNQAYRAIIAKNKFAPTYVVFSHLDESENLFKEFCELLTEEANLVFLVPNINQNSIGGYISYLNAVLIDLKNKVETHPQRLYLGGFRNGASIAMAVSKWQGDKVKGTFLINGYHWPMTGHPIIKNDVFAFAHKDGREYSSFEVLKKKHEKYNVKFVIEEFDKEKELPSKSELFKIVEYFDTNWAEYHDGITDMDRQKRLDLFETKISKISETVLSPFDYFYEIKKLYQQFKNSSHPVLINKNEKLLSKIESLKNKHTEILDYEKYEAQFKNFKEEKKTYENIMAFIEINNALVNKYPQEKFIENFKKEITTWQEYIKVRKLELSKIEHSNVIAAYLQFIENKYQDDQAKYDRVNKFYELCKRNKEESDFIPQSLMLVNVDYQSAMMAYANNELRDSYKKLFELKSVNIYMDAYRLFYLAKINMLNEKFEIAEKQFEEFLTDHYKNTTHFAEAFFNLAFCKYKNLEYENAKNLLEEFQMRFPEAGERMRIAAYQLLEKIESFEEGGLSDVEEKMSFSQRKLRHGDLEKDTQKNQDEIVKLLGKLIEQEEKKEQENRNRRKNKGNQGGSGGNPDSPAEESNLPTGQAELGTLKNFNKGDAKDSWGKMRDKEREKVFNEIKKDLPPEYKNLIEQYFKKLQQDE